MRKTFLITWEHSFLFSFVLCLTNQQLSSHTMCSISIEEMCNVCQERSDERKWWPTSQQKVSPKSKSIGSVRLKPASSVCPLWSKQKISKAQARDCCLSNACCHSKGLGVSKMLREPSRCDTPPTAESCPSGVAAGSRAGCLRALKCHYMPVFAKCIQFQMSLTKLTTDWDWGWEIM